MIRFAASFWGVLIWATILFLAGGLGGYLLRGRPTVTGEPSASAAQLLQQERRIHQAVLREEEFWTRAHREEAERLRDQLAQVSAAIGVDELARILGEPR